MGQRTKRNLQLGRIQERIARDFPQSLQSRAQYWRCGCCVRQRWEGHEADYYVPLLAHASMEPMVALAEFKDGKATLWAPTQNPQAVQDIVSKELGIAKEDVICM